MLLSCHSWTPFAIKIIWEIQLRNNDFFVLIYGFIIPGKPGKPGKPGCGGPGGDDMSPSEFHPEEELS